MFLCKNQRKNFNYLQLHIDQKKTNHKIKTGNMVN